MLARLRTMKCKRECALWVRDETVADPTGKVSNEPINAVAMIEGLRCVVKRIGIGMIKIMRLHLALKPPIIDARG